MCSVSFLPHSPGFYVGMNRDESLVRPVAHPPKPRRKGGRATLYPTEPAGGSWVGVNDAGLALALINWYAVARVPGGGCVSRGMVVPSLLGAGKSEEIRTGLECLPLAKMAPFRLIALAPRERFVAEFRWNQRTLDEVRYEWEPRHWFSSGYDEPRAQEVRGEVAREAWREPGAGRLPWLRRLHASHAPARGPFCFCMHRREAATVSYSEIVVTSCTAMMRYFDGPPCCVPQPGSTRKLSLNLCVRNPP